MDTTVIPSQPGWENPAPQPERPKFADYFEILGDNENGGMGEVYFCRDKRSGQLYALKKAKADPKYETALKQEAAFALELGKHPNIVYTATIGHEGDMYYIVMELIGQTDGPRPQGNTLVNEFNKHPEGLPMEQAYQWAIEFCEGMKYLNSKGMKAHKDIKPANLFITPEGHLKIGDFGLASVGENKGIGTKGYRAPEIKNGIYDVRTDIYAFGIVLYQLLNKGFNPLDNTQYTHADTRMDKQDESAFPRADTLKSRHGVDILRKCLQPNPSARYQTFTELEEDLIQALRTLNPQYQFTPAQEEPLNAEEYFGKGLGWAELTNFHKAIKNYDKAIELAPQYTYAYNNRGNVKLYIKDYVGGIADYNKSIELDPQYANAYNNRGNAKYCLKDYVGAIADYDKAIALDPQYAQAYYNRGNLQKDLKNYTGAIENYNKAIELNPEYAVAYNNRGIAYADLKDYAGAIADYDKAIELDPQNANAYNNRGNSKTGLKDYVGAYKDYNIALSLFPKSFEIYNSRGCLKNILKDYVGAINDFDKAIFLNSKYAEAFYNRGIAKYHLDRYREAIADYNKAIDLNPQYVAAYSNRGTAQKKVKNYTGAMLDYDKTIELEPQNFINFYNRGNLYAVLGKYAEAITDYDKSLELCPLDAMSYNNRGNVKWYIKDYTGAFADYRKALDFMPQNTIIYKNLISLCVALNQPEMAEKIRRLKQKNCPDNQ